MFNLSGKKDSKKETIINLDRENEFSKFKRNSKSIKP